MAHTAVSSTVVCCLQSQHPTHQSASITAHCTQNVSVLVFIIKQWLAGA